MSRIRLYEIAKELGKESKEVVARAKELGLEVSASRLASRLRLKKLLSLFQKKR